MTDRPSVSDLRKAAHDAIINIHADHDGEGVVGKEAAEASIDALADRAEEAERDNIGLRREVGMLEGSATALGAMAKEQAAAREKAEREVGRLKQHVHPSALDGKWCAGCGAALRGGESK